MKIERLEILSEPTRLEAVLDGVRTMIDPKLLTLSAGLVALADEKGEWDDRLPFRQIPHPDAPGIMRTLWSHTDDPVVVCVARRFLATCLGLDGAPEYKPGAQPVPTLAEAQAENAAGRFGFPPLRA